MQSLYLFYDGLKSPDSRINVNLTTSVTELYNLPMSTSPTLPHEIRELRNVCTSDKFLITIYDGYIKDTSPRRNRVNRD